MRRQGLTCIHQFRASSVSAVRELIHYTIDVSYSPVYPPRAVQFFKDFHSEAKIIERHQKGEILVVEKDGKVIGTGSIVDIDILGVFVNPEFQHQVHGKSLMQELEKKAVVNGISEVVLSVSLPSRRFYESLGYEIFEDRTIDVGEGQRLDYWEAKKTLTLQKSEGFRAKASRVKL
jgi:N-acetylglutamate synthase-like GNAT family acetyltransferase